MPYKPDEREYRLMDITVRAVAETEDAGNNFIVEGYATTYNDPYVMKSRDGITVREQVDPSAFDNTDMSDVIMQYDHQGRVFARLSNGTMRLENDEHGLKVIADLGGTTIGRELYEEIKGGYTRKMSFGFTISSYTETETYNDDGTIDVLETITGVGRLYDVSAVSLPANPNTSIVSQRSAFIDGVIDKRIEELEKKRAADSKKKRLALLISLAQEE